MNSILDIIPEESIAKALLDHYPDTEIETARKYIKARIYDCDTGEVIYDSTGKNHYVALTLEINDCKSVLMLLK